MKGTAQDPLRFMVFGSFSGLNFGDTAVLRSIMAAVERVAGPHVRFLVPTNHPDRLRRLLPYERLEPIDIDLRRARSYRFLGPGVLRHLREVDVALTTAGILFDYRFFDPRVNCVSSLLPVLALARRRGTRVYGMHVGVTAPTSRFGAWALSKTLRLHDHVTTRDGPSLDLVRTLAPDVPSHASADVAHALVAPPDGRPGGTVGCNLAAYLDRLSTPGRRPGKTDPGAREAMVQAVATTLDALHERAGVPVAFVSTTPMDHDLHLEVARRMAAPHAHHELHEMDQADAEETLLGLDVLVGSRMHACLVATSLGIPTLAIAYHPKVRSYMESIGMGDRVVEVADVAQHLPSAAASLWDERATIEASLRETSRGKQAQVASDLQHLAHLLEAA